MRSARPDGIGTSASQFFKPEPGKRTLLVMGGSSGAMAINDFLIGCLPYLEHLCPWLRIIHSAGSLHYEVVRKEYARCKLQSIVVPFIEEMAAAYQAADLVVCRAGGMSVAELCVAGKPAILIPFPYAADDHQRKNALFMSCAGAAVLMDQFRTSPLKLCDEILRILGDENRLRNMTARSLALARPNAARSVVGQIEFLLRRRAVCGALSVTG